MTARIGPLRGIVLRGWAVAAPGAALDDADLRRLLAARAPAWSSAPPEQDARDLGVGRRHWIAPGERLEELAARAARAALARAGLEPAELGLLVVATSTPPRITSSLAGALARDLGTGAGAHDVRAGGAGGLQAWIDACAWLAAGVPSALVVAVETPSRLCDPRARAAFLYGDGAAALVLVREPGSSAGLVEARVWSAPLAGVAFTVPGALPPERASLERGDYRFQRPDRAYLEGLETAWDAAGGELLEMLRAAPQPAHVAPYPVTRRQLERLATRLGAGASGLAGAMDCLHERGCLGAAGALTAVAAALGPPAPAESLLASLAVGGGGHAAAVLWDLD